MPPSWIPVLFQYSNDRSSGLSVVTAEDGFVALSDGSSILNSAYPDDQGGVALLHRLLETGRRDFSFAGDAKASPVGFSNPEGSLRIPAYSQDPERLFVGRREPIAVEEWTLEGRLVRTVFLPGGEWRLERPGGSPGYSAGIQHLRVDGEGRLWVIIRVVDPSWEEAMEEVSHGHRTSQAISDYNRYWDSVVEVWDKEGRSVLARKQFPEFFLGFLESGEVYSYRTTEEAIPFVDIHDLRSTIQGVHQERRWGNECGPEDWLG